MTALINSPAHTGIVIPKSDLRIIPAQGRARVHLANYATNWEDEPLKYAAIKRAFALLDETGVLGYIDQLCFLAVDEDGSLLNWVAGGVAPVNVNMPWVSGLGFQGDGATTYIDTGINPSSTPGLQYGLSQAHVGVYMSDVGTGSFNNVPIGQAGGSSRLVLYANLGTGSTGFRINMDTTVNFVNPMYGVAGFYLLNRTGDTARVVLNGEAVYSGPGQHPAVSLPTQNITIGANFSGTTRHTDGAIAGWSIGNALGVGNKAEAILNEAVALLAAAFINP